jgi:heme-degrading monooxygenase HmoA
MLIRIVKATPQPGQIDELARRWESFIGVRLKEMPGFRRAYFTADRGANATAAISVWDAPPDPATVGQMMQEFRERVSDLVGGTSPTVEEYDVLVEV